MRQLTFRQVLVVPTLATLGLGLLLAAQDISFTGPMGMAAPIVEAKMPRIAMNTNGPNALELPGFQEESDEVKATSQTQLKRLAKENSGREDPFVPLMAPDPTIVVPTPAPPPTPEPLPPMPAPNPKAPVKIVKRVVRVKVKDPKTGQFKTVMKTVYEPVSFVPNDEPDWTVTGIFSTGYDVFAILEQGDNTREVRSGDILDDNTQVLDVNSQSVTLYKNGHKYTKSIGEKSHE